MKAPDKIYINKYMLRRGMLYPAQKPAEVPEFEYIRKDALLEWARGFTEPKIFVSTLLEKLYSM